MSATREQGKAVSYMPTDETREQRAGALITVQARKMDGRAHRRWRAQVAQRVGSLIVLDAVFAEEVNHPLLGHIARGTVSREYYWTDRWYNIFRFAAADGALRNFYCNISQPAQLADGLLCFVDLDIDVLVAPDFSYRVLDLDEFAEHATLYGYAPELRARAYAALTELIALIEKREFPFAVAP